jgi:predicted helicase
VPLAKDGFARFAQIGMQLAQLHLGYERRRSMSLAGKRTATCPGRGASRRCG